jgi:hypothetical protein
VADSTRFSLLRALALLAILALAGGFLAATARADGDPASDVLVTQQLFLPQDAGLPTAQQAQLGALLQEAARDGFPIRVALIASPADLGSVTALWRQPQNYARFLGQELAFTYHGPLLVVMPDGFGFYGFTGRAADTRAAVTGTQPGSGALGSAALTAVQRLAAASGHRLPLPNAVAVTRPQSDDTTPWIAFAIGAMLILVAWAASLRARPLRPRHIGG